MKTYAEFIFGCTLSKDTPNTCVNALNYLINNEEIHDSLPKELDEFIEKYNIIKLINSKPNNFGGAPYTKFYFDRSIGEYRISIRSSLNNNAYEIEDFLRYIKPYITKGSGPLDIYAYIHYEEFNMPIIYSLNGIFDTSKLTKSDNQTD